MPRYFFHLVHPDRDPVRDDEGITFDDDAGAKLEGLTSLGELVRDTARDLSFQGYVSVQIVRAGAGVIAILTARVT